MRGWRGRTGVSVRCKRVVQELKWRGVGGRQHGGNGGNIAGIWREWREWRKSRVKAGEFFSGSCCCYAVASVFSFIESIPGSGNRNAILAHARHAPVSRRLGSGRAVFLLLDFCAWLRTRFLAVSGGCRAAFCHPRALLRLQIPCQRESWLRDDETLSVMPVRISVTVSASSYPQTSRSSPYVWLFANDSHLWRVLQGLCLSLQLR